MTLAKDDRLLLSLTGLKFIDCDILTGRAFIKAADSLLGQKSCHQAKQFVLFCRSTIQCAKRSPGLLDELLSDLRLAAKSAMREGKIRKTEYKLMRSWYLHSLSFLEYRLGNLNGAIIAVDEAIRNDYDLTYCDGFSVFSHSCFMLAARYISLHYLMDKVFFHEALPDQILAILGLSSEHLVNQKHGLSIHPNNHAETLVNRVLNAAFTPPIMPNKEQRRHISSFIMQLTESSPELCTARMLNEFAAYLDSESLSIDSSRVMLEAILAGGESSLALWYIPLLHILEDRSKYKMVKLINDDIVTYPLKMWIMRTPSYVLPAEIKCSNKCIQLLPLRS